jgi:hypothetical protein
LEAAVLLNGRLLDSIHLTLQYRQLSGILLIPADEENRRPEDNDADRVVATASLVDWLSCCPAAAAAAPAIKSAAKTAPNIPRMR